MTARQSSMYEVRVKASTQRHKTIILCRKGCDSDNLAFFALCKVEGLGIWTRHTSRCCGSDECVLMQALLGKDCQFCDDLESDAERLREEGEISGHDAALL